MQAKPRHTQQFPIVSVLMLVSLCNAVGTVQHKLSELSSVLALLVIPRIARKGVRNTSALVCAHDLLCSRFHAVQHCAIHFINA